MLRQKENNRCIQFRDLVIPYVEIENRLKAMEEKLKTISINDSENKQILIDENYSKPPKKNFATNRTDVHHIGDIWSLDILDLKDYGPEKNKCYRYVLVVINKFLKFGFTIPLKNKNAETIKDSFEKNC